MKLLIDEGADIDACDDNSNTPLHFAACRCGLQIVQLLIDNGANIDARDRNSETALNFAVLRHSLDIVKILVENGADIHAVDSKSRTALQRATMLDGGTSVVRFLASKGADESQARLYLEKEESRLAALDDNKSPER